VSVIYLLRPFPSLTILYLSKIDPPKFNPQLKVPPQFAAVPTSTTAQTQSLSQSTQTLDKILITIRHDPTEKENKFKVKSTHLVGRVLTSACSAFGLNSAGWVSPRPYLWLID